MGVSWFGCGCPSAHKREPERQSLAVRCAGQHCAKPGTCAPPTGEQVRIRPVLLTITRASLPPGELRVRVTLLPMAMPRIGSNRVADRLACALIFGKLALLMTANAHSVPTGMAHASTAVGSASAGSQDWWGRMPNRQSVVPEAACVTVIAVVCLIASERANCRCERTASAAPATRRLSSMSVSMGCALLITMASTARVTSNSTKVKPRI